MAADSSDPTAADDRDGKSSGADAPDTAAAATTDPSATGSAAASTTDEPAGPTDPNSADSGTTPASAAEPDADASTPYSPALIATAVALPVILIVGVLVAAFIALRAPVEREPLALGPVPAPAADGPACQALLPALPADLGDYTKSTLVEPAPPATRAWQHPDGGEPIVLRCGLDRPLEFNRASPLTVVDGVKWFQVRDEVGKVGTWFAVDRETYIALTVPDGSGAGSIQTVSEVITANLPAREPTPGEL
ncbi:DUF3515 domain-containing protein [Nocardia canadensis]|uniref:DUF3515 domain-containing protein n=1 Tax=Nocardia canadensis TaxID=3065238 RepID=UPI00292F69D4|nr:DUF3515 family protein [Nocardia canadensis]